MPSLFFDEKVCMIEETRKYVKQADESFWAQNEAGCTYDTEKTEFQNLMALSVEERGDALKEGVTLLYTDPNDSSTVNKIIRAPYIARFSQYLIPLIQSLEDAEQEDLLTMSAFEYIVPRIRQEAILRKKKNYLQEIISKKPDYEQEKILHHDDQGCSFLNRFAKSLLGRSRGA